MILEQDILCRRCQYNLRGLLPSAMCPECGTPVSYSLRDDLLRFSDPEYVGRLSTGMLLMLLATVLPFVLGLLAVVPMGSADQLLQLLGFGLSALALLGAWYLTRPDPAGLGEERYGKWRRITWTIVLISFSAGLVSDLADMIAGVSLTFGLMTVLGLMSLGSELGNVFMLLYLEKLSARIGDTAQAAKLGNRAQTLRWMSIFVLVGGALVAIGGALLFAAAGPTNVGPGLPPPAGGAAGLVMVGGCVTLIIALTRLLIAVGWLVLMIGYRSALARETELSEDNWVRGANSN